MGRAAKRRKALAAARALGLVAVSMTSFGAASAASAGPALALELPAGTSQALRVATQSTPLSSAAPTVDAGAVAGTVSASKAPGTPAESSRRASPPATSTQSSGSGVPPSSPPPPRTIRTLLEATVHAVEADVSGAPAGSREGSSSEAPRASKPMSESGMPGQPSAIAREPSPIVRAAASTVHSATAPSAGRATGLRRAVRSARVDGALPAGAAGAAGPTAAAARGATSAASASSLASGARFDFHAPSRHGLAASVPSRGSLLSALAPASSGSLLALLLVFAALIGGTLVVLGGVGYRPRARDWRRHIAE